MSRAVDDSLSQDSPLFASALISGTFTRSHNREAERIVAGNVVANRAAWPRRTPRKSLIVVLPDNHVLSPDVITERLPSDNGAEEMDVIVACAGPPRNLGPLQRKVRDLQILLAPAGTSTGDLRELAMKRAPGDIITLMSGSPSEREGA